MATQKSHSDLRRKAKQKEPIQSTNKNPKNIKVKVDEQRICNYRQDCFSNHWHEFYGTKLFHL